MKRRRVDYAPKAAADLEWIYDMVARSRGPEAAARYDGRIRAYCDGLETASERGTLRDDVRPGMRVIGFERRIAVVFVVDGDTVTILRIHYGGADWERTV